MISTPVTLFRVFPKRLKRISTNKLSAFITSDPQPKIKIKQRPLALFAHPPTTRTNYLLVVFFKLLMVYPAVRIEAQETHTASFIFLHGLGDNGRGWTFLAEEAIRQNRLRHVKFIFPDAPEQPVSLNYGMTMQAWYDIKSLANVQTQQDEEGVIKSIDRLNQIINEEIEAGIPTERILIGGFSQGCAISLSNSIISNNKMAGVVGLSGYLPIKEKLLSLESPANRLTPYFICHGTADNVVKFSAGKMSRDYLINDLNRENVVWKEYQDMVHTASPEEVSDLFAFAESVLPKT